MDFDTYAQFYKNFPSKIKFICHLALLFTWIDQFRFKISNLKFVFGKIWACVFIQIIFKICYHLPIDFSRRNI